MVLFEISRNQSSPLGRTIRCEGPRRAHAWPKYDKGIDLSPNQFFESACIGKSRSPEIQKSVAPAYGFVISIRKVLKYWPT